MARSMLTQWEEMQRLKIVQGPPTRKWGGVHAALGAHVQDDGPSDGGVAPPVSQGFTKEQLEVLQAMMDGSKVSRDGGGGGGMGGAPMPTCYNCGKKGHLKSECKKNRIGDGFTFSPRSLKAKANN
jgi:hypothetical protein